MNLILAYVGPETFLPVTSVLAAIVGFFLTMGKSSLSMLTGFFQRSTPKDEVPAEKPVEI